MYVIKIRYTYSFIVVIYYKSHIFLKIPEFLMYKTYAYMYSRHVFIQETSIFLTILLIVTCN